MDCPYDNYTYFERYERSASRSVSDLDEFEYEDDDEWYLESGDAYGD